MSFYYSNVPLVNEDKCPTHLQHNYLANQFNLRLKTPGPSCAWSIFYYANSIFTNMRNMAGNNLTPALMGRRPPEDEWWKIYAYIEHPTAETGEGNWPLVPAGFPEGANVMNPVNAYIFGRITAENRPQMSSAGLSVNNKHFRDLSNHELHQIKKIYEKDHKEKPRTVLDENLGEIMDKCINFLTYSFDGYSKKYYEAEIMEDIYDGDKSTYEMIKVHLIAAILFIRDDSNILYIGIVLIFISMMMYLVNITTS